MHRSHTAAPTPCLALVIQRTGSDLQAWHCDLDLVAGAAGEVRSDGEGEAFWHFWLSRFGLADAANTHFGVRKAMGLNWI